MGWERARSEAQKEKRVLEIVQATARLYAKMDYEKISFASIAREAEFTRSNVYKYFQNKEEIFLEFIKHDLAAWRAEVCSALPARSDTAGAFAALWVETILAHKRLFQLFSILFTTIEKNSSLDNLVFFKQKVFAETELLAGLLLSLFPNRAPNDLLEFIYAQFALSIGIYPLLELSEKQLEAMKRAGATSGAEYHQKIFVKSIQSLAETMLYK